MSKPHFEIPTAPLQIIVADDCRMMRRVMPSIIRECVDIDPANITCVANAEEAFELVKKLNVNPQKPNVLLLTDHGFQGGMNGEMLIEKIRSELRIKNLPVLLITGLGSNSLADLVNKDRFVGILEKPVKESTIKIGINTLLAPLLHETLSPAQIEREKIRIEMSKIHAAASRRADETRDALTPILRKTGAIEACTDEGGHRHHDGYFKQDHLNEKAFKLSSDLVEKARSDRTHLERLQRRADNLDKSLISI